MKNMMKSVISILLVLSMMLGTVVMVSAADDIKEEYLSDLRLIYAETYDEAKLVLTDSKLEGYKILNNNLNEKSGKTGVWLAYKTTEDVNEAITDVAIMQMGGGYSSANYQEMINNSKAEYEAMGEIYLDAIDYFAEAYEAEDFLAETAYRQLNFYAGLDKYTEERLGDLFVDGALKKTDLATLFFEGNAKVTDNIRSLLAMGVSYNEDGKHYLEKVGEFVKDMDADATIEFNQVYNDLSQFIAPVLPVFRTMFEELSAYEAEFNYEDEELTDLELKYVEYKAIADRLRAIQYLGDQTLYDFCMAYTMDASDYTSIYPLAAALNEGQIAMTKVSHYYDVVRYSMSDYPEETIDQEITALEEKYEDESVDVYLGVDRDVYSQTFALTTAAYRADAYTESTSLMDALFGNSAWVDTTKQLAVGAVGVGLFVWAIVRTAKGGFGVTEGMANQMTNKALDKVGEKAFKAAEELATETMYSWGAGNQSYLSIVEELYEKYSVLPGGSKIEDWGELCLGDKLDNVKNMMIKHYDGAVSNGDTLIVDQMSKDYLEKYTSTNVTARDSAMRSVKLSVIGGRIFTGLLYIAGAVSLAYSAINLYKQIRDHYHPTYDEIPTAMVDLIKTADGDRYIKYDVVLEAQKKDGEYHAADLNAFAGERWNAIYYTKSSEAGKPLLADFEISNSDNHVDEGYIPVCRFGEGICYDLNKYNFSSDSAMIFMSIRQSENVKSDVTLVPNIIGTIFGSGAWLLMGCFGVIIGVGCTIGTQKFLGKKKNGETESEQ